jgi:cytochrome P450
MDAYFRTIVRARRNAAPRTDVIGGLIAAEESGRALSEDELVATSVLVLFAGHETTTNLIGNGMIGLLRYPEAMTRLRDEPGLMECAVEEMLRYDGPAATVTRVAKDDIEIDGRRISKGDRLFLGLNAANRDPERFADPDRFDPARPDNRHLAFGYGPHFCIGAPLARLEAKLAFDRLLTRISHIALASDRIEWVDNLVLRGVKSLKLHLANVREARPRERAK